MVEDLATSCLDGKCPSQVGNVYHRPVSFYIWSVCAYSLSGGGVLLINRDRPGSFSRQDGYSIGSVTDKP